VVPLLNGVEHMALLRHSFEPSRVVAGSIGRIEVKRTAFDVVLHTNPEAWIGLAAAPPAAARAEAVARLLRAAGFEVDLAADEPTLLWGKLVRLAPLACLTAASQLTLGEVRRREPWASLLQAAVAEVAAVARAHGARVSADEALSKIAALPGHISTSLARDIAAGGESELDAIAGAVRRAAAAAGLACPTVDALHARLGGLSEAPCA
jgi:2-dehydropantoate 2-reductase